MKMKIKFLETQKGLYLTGESNGVKYGQGYATKDKGEAEVLFVRLVRTFETKGDLYVAKYGVK
jgi:hypothetical protein